MTDRRAELRAELQQVVSEGFLIMGRELMKGASPETRAKFAKALGLAPSGAKGAKEGAKDSGDAETEKREFSFGADYQAWYSKSLRVVEQLLPDRHEEFVSLYRVERRKTLDVETYGIADYIRGLTVSHWGEPAFDTHGVALGKLEQQIAILRSAESRLDSLLADIQGVLEASLFDDELDAARDLLKAKHVRAAGIIAGVVLERHLQRVLANHKVTFRKKATLANLNEALKSSGVYDVPQWRRVQHLTDIRNLCGHSGERDPSADEVSDLITGVENAVKTVF